MYDAVSDSMICVVCQNFSRKNSSVLLSDKNILSNKNILSIINMFMKKVYKLQLHVQLEIFLEQ